MGATELINKFGGWTESYWFYVDSANPIELRYDPKDHVYLLVTDDGDLEKQLGVTTVCHIIDKSEALVPWGCKMMAQKLIRTAPWLTKEGVGDYIAMIRTDAEAWILAAKDAHQEKLEDAGAVGHIAHNWIENYIKLILAGEIHLAEQLKIILPKEERAAQACRAAFDWMGRHNVKWLATERKIYSRRYKYAGTMDGLCLCDSCDDPKCCPNEFKERLTVADWKTSNYLYMEYLFQTAAYQYAYMEETGQVVLDRWIIRLGKEDGEFEAWHREPHNFDMDFGGFTDALQMTRRVKEVEQNLKERRDDIRAALKAERDAARAVKEALEAEERAIAKAAKQQARVEALAKECPKAKKYKGVRAPTCTTNIGQKIGQPCDKCTEIYDLAQEAKKYKPVTVSGTQKIGREKRKKFLEGTTPESLKANRGKMVDYNALDAIAGRMRPFEEDIDEPETEDLEIVVVPAEAPIRETLDFAHCDGEHGASFPCLSTYCWQLPDIRRMLPAKASPWRYQFIDDLRTNTLDTDVPSVVG